MKFTQIDPSFDVWVASAGHDRGRILIFRPQTIPPDPTFDHVPGAQVILIGDIHKQLRTLMQQHGRPTISQRIPGGISNRTYPAIRKYLGLSG